MNEFKKKKHPLGFTEAVPRPTEAYLNEFYRNQYFKAGVTFTYQQEYSPDELKQKKFRATASNESIAQILSEKGSSISFLEIGTGEGFLLADAISRGWVCRGVDFQKSTVEKFNPGALPAFVDRNPSEYLQEMIAREEKFSAIALQNVLEHTLYPDVLMDGLRKIIEPDGVVLIQVPNDYSRLQEVVAAKGYIDREYWFLPPDHLNYFNPKTLAAYARDKGFEVVDGFSDFPIEFYLWGNTTNYTKDRTLGPLAHKARVEIDLIAAEAGVSEYLDFYRSMYRVGLGRNICVLLRALR